MTGESIDAVLASVRLGQKPPEDTRSWVFVEIVGGQLTWTVHNIALRDARHLLEDVREDMRDEIKRMEPKQ
jgi:uncharacterized protein (DUF2164 family)